MSFSLFEKVKRAEFANVLRLGSFFFDALWLAGVAGTNEDQVHYKSNLPYGPIFQGQVTLN
jgi:hypothetical protein